MIIVFVVDTSVSMNQRANNGMTLLDIAKASIEYFLKIRGRDLQAIRNDRFFLVTYEEGLSAVKAGWKDTFGVFMQEVKSLVARDMSNAGGAIKRAFDLLNQFRLQTSIDNYGLGRNPWFIEPAVLVHVTDGGPLTTLQGVSETLSLPLAPQAGSELTLEPFRWDQRLYSVVLQFSGSNTASAIDATPISGPISEVTGGRCISVTSMKALYQAIEGIVTKLQVGVQVNFECAAPPQSSLVSPPPCFHRTLYLRSNTSGNWPIPESFLPEPAMTQLPPRTAHPTIRYMPIDNDPFMLENFPFDKYEIESCQLTSALLTYKPGVCWPAYVAGSTIGPGSNGEPFGYLKGSTNTSTVNLFVLPYNYPRLWPLLDELSNVHKMMPTTKWKQEFDKYIASIPFYYVPPLRNALKRWGAPPNLLPDYLDSGLNYTVSTYLKKLKQQSKAETDRIQPSAMLIGKPKELAQVQPMVLSTSRSPSPPPSPKSASRSFHQLLDRSPDLDKPEKDGDGLPAVDAIDLGFSFSNMMGDIDAAASQQAQNPRDMLLYRNAFDIQRDSLISTIDRLRAHIYDKQDEDDDSKHSVPVSQMGNYHEVLKKRETLRELDEEDERRAKMPLFGNPFVRPDKIASRLVAASGIAIDEAVEESGSNSAASTTVSNAMPNRNKRARSTSPLPQRAIPTAQGLSAKRSKPPSIAAPKLAPPKALPPPASLPILAEIDGSLATVMQPEISKPVAVAAVISAFAAPDSPMPQVRAVPVAAVNGTSMPTLVPSPAKAATVPATPKAAQAKSASIPNPVDIELKSQIMKEVRKPGKNNQELFKLLGQLKGTTADTRAYIQELKQHALSFKKQTLISELDTFEKTLI